MKKHNNNNNNNNSSSKDDNGPKPNDENKQSNDTVPKTSYLKYIVAAIAVLIVMTLPDRRSEKTEQRDIISELLKQRGVDPGDIIIPDVIQTINITETIPLDSITTGQPGASYSIRNPITIDVKYPVDNLTSDLYPCEYPRGLSKNHYAVFYQSLITHPVSYTLFDVIHTLSVISVQTEGLEDHPFGDDLVSNKNDDIRLGNCGVYTSIKKKVGLSTHKVGLGIHMTNNGIWAIIDNADSDAIMGSRIDNKDKEMFFNAHRITDRVSSSNSTVEIVYNQVEDLAEFIVDGRHTHRVHNVSSGKPSSGVNVVIFKNPNKKLLDGFPYNLNEEGEELTSFGVYYVCGSMFFASDPNNAASTKGLVSHNTPDGTRDKDEDIFKHPTSFLSPDSDRGTNANYWNWTRSLHMDVFSITAYRDSNQVAGSHTQK